MHWNVYFWIDNIVYRLIQDLAQESYWRFWWIVSHVMVSLLYKLNCFLSDYSKGFGGKFGIQTDRVDKSAVGFDHLEKVSKHESQRGWSVWPAWVFCLLAWCLSLQRTYFKPPPHKNLSVQCCETFVPLDTRRWNFCLQIRSVKIEVPSFTFKASTYTMSQNDNFITNRF